MDEVIADPTGFQAILTDECWKHIVSRHPEMETFRHLVVETVQGPNAVYLAGGIRRAEFIGKDI